MEIMCIMDELDKLLNNPVINFKSRVMAGMLNGTIDWNKGVHIRNYLDSLSEEEAAKLIRKEDTQPVEKTESSI